MLDLIETSSRPRALLDMCHQRAINPWTYKWIVGVALKVTAAGETVTWGRDSGRMDAEGFRSLLREALDVQITARGARPTGRKHQSGYQRALRQDAALLCACRERGERVPSQLIRTPELWKVVR